VAAGPARELGRAALGRGVAAKTRTRAAAGSLLFLLVSPGVFAGLIPWLLTRWEMRDPFEGWVALRIVGVLLLAAGTGVVLQAFARFAFEGFGTPAPFAPPQRLVVGGLYRYVRNPMYFAVTAVIAGQALLLGRPWLLLYAAGFLAVVAAFARWYEEPALRRKFGADYDEYRRTVPGWLPRRRR